jgi:hypothetical protein
MTTIAALYYGYLPTPPAYAAIAVSASGDTTLVAAVPGLRIVLLAYNYMANGTVNAKWKSGAGTDITGLAYLVANTGKVAPFNPAGWCITAVGQALVLNLSASIAVGGELSYALI